MFAIFAMSSTLGIVPIARYYISGMGSIARIVVIAVALPLLVLAFAYANRAYRRYPTLVCSHCQGNLSHRTQFVVIASGNCPHCGRRALIDPVIGT